MQNGTSKIDTYLKKERKSQSQLQVPDIYEDQDLMSDSSYENSQKQKKRHRKKNNKKQKIQSNNLRKDKYGIEIVKGGKKHKIQFATKLQETKIVENWKMYNNEDYEEETQKSSCCIII